eukprot:364930-Chlamydomonas_euryale.AAC.3
MTVGRYMRVHGGTLRGAWHVHAAGGKHRSHSMRKNELSELLYGPLLYGIVSAAWTVIWWRDSPIGLVGLIALFAGDGCAGFFGVRYGHVLGTLPHNPNKVGTCL